MDPAATAAVSTTVSASVTTPDAKNISSDQKPADPNSNSTITTTKLSRWSDGSLSGDPNPEEPPQKKVKSDVTNAVESTTPTAATSTATAATTATNVSSTTGYGEAAPGLAYAAAAAAAAAAVTATTTSSSFAVPVYGALQQQASAYQSYGAQYQATYGSFAPGSAAKGSSALFYKTKLCTKFKIGACTFNERCHFAHGVEDLRKPAPGWETVVGLSGTASTMQARAKTRPCRYFAEGNCPYGDRCNFLHGNEEPQKLWSAAGAYAPAATTDIYQGYSAAPAYSNGAAYPNSDPNQAMTANTTTMAAPYGVTADNSIATLGSAPNANLYANATAVNPYAMTQTVSNGSSANYNYWNTTAANPAQSYTQYSQTQAWIPNYATGNEAAVPSYNQEHLQQQQSVTTTPYMQSASYPGGSY